MSWPFKLLFCSLFAGLAQVIVMLFWSTYLSSFPPDWMMYGMPPTFLAIAVALVGLYREADTL